MRACRLGLGFRACNGPGPPELGLGLSVSRRLPEDHAAALYLAK